MQLSDSARHSLGDFEYLPIVNPKIGALIPLSLIVNIEENVTTHVSTALTGSAP